MKTKYHYFFYGTCTENVLSQFIRAAEEKGCELLSVHPGVQQLQSRLAMGNGQPQVVQIFKVFVCCALEDWPGVEKLMEAEAQKQLQEGLRT